MSRNAPHVVILTLIVGLGHYALLTADLAHVLAQHGLTTVWLGTIDRTSKFVLWLGTLVIILHITPKVARFIADCAEAVIKFWEVTASGFDYLWEHIWYWTRRALRQIFNWLVKMLEDRE